MSTSSPALFVNVVLVPDQVGTLSQVRTKKISKGGWTALEPFEPHGNEFSFSK